MPCRFNIGTAASAVTAAVVPLGLTHTGADSAAEWRPEHIGEPEEDYPLFTIIRLVICRPIDPPPTDGGLGTHRRGPFNPVQ